MEKKTLLNMRLLDKQFEEVRGFMGTKVTYLKSEVDEYLQKVAEEVEQIEKQNLSLQRRLDLAESERSISTDFHSSSEEEISLREKDIIEKGKMVDKMEVTLKRMLIMAEEQAEKIRKDATVEAQSFTDKQRVQAENLLREAKRRHEEAMKESDEIVGDAKLKKEKIMNSYKEVKDEMQHIHKYIEESILSEDKVEQPFFVEETKKIVGNE